MANQAVFVILAVFFALASCIPDDDSISGYLGCFPNPLIAGYQFGPGYKSDSETVREDCSAFCYGQNLQYAYLRNSECLCDPYGDFTNPAAAVADSLCDAEVYDGPAGSTNGEYVSAYLTGFSYSFRVLNSCWSKPAGITSVTTTLANNQPATCISHCSFLNFTAAGVSNGDQCSCFSYDDIVSGASHIVSESNCDIPCPGLWSATCGGPTGLDIYPTEDVYLGCYVDTAARVLNQAAPTTGVETTVELCQGLCWAGGYLYAGLQDGDQCFCGSTPGTLAPETDCNTPCAADSTETCGGAWRNSVYTAYLIWENPTQPAGWYQSSNGLFTSDYATVFGRK